MLPSHRQSPLLRSRTATISGLWLALIGSLFVARVTSDCPATSGATTGLLTLLEGKCLQFTQFVDPGAFCGDSGQSVNCSEVAELFVNAIAFQDKCNVPLERFQPFLNITRHPLPQDKSMFWEDVYSFQDKYVKTGQRKLTVSYTLQGYMLDGVRFCSDPSQPDGIGGGNTQDCPTFSDTENCTRNAEYSFWAASSVEYASLAKGVVTIMLNASTGTATDPDTFFATWEVPNLREGVVTRADIWLMHVPGQEVKETCDSEGVAALGRRLENKNITWSCTENPSDAFWLLCWDYRDAEECKAEATSSGSDAVFGDLETCLILLTITSVLFGRIRIE